MSYYSNAMLGRDLPRDLRGNSACDIPGGKTGKGFYFGVLAEE